MAKSKCSIYVVNSKGGAWTTRRGARRLIARGLASGNPESGSIRMVEGDPRFHALAVATKAAADNAARLAVIVARNMASGQYRNEVLGLPNFVRTGTTGDRSSVGVEV